MLARRAPGVYFTCQGVLTLKIRSPDKVSGLNVSQVPFSSNVSIERSNSRERFLDFCREPERTTFSLRTVSIERTIRILFFLSSSRRLYVSACRSFILVILLPTRDDIPDFVLPEKNLKPIQVST